MNLKSRVEKIEEKAGVGKETLLVIIDTFHSEDEEGLNELPEDSKEWITFKEQMENPKVNNGVLVFKKDYLKELEARKLAHIMRKLK